MQDDRIQPGELLTSAPTEITSLAVEAARAELELEAAERRADIRERAVRSLLQGAIAAALESGLEACLVALGSGQFTLMSLARASGFAALTAFVSYIHNRLKPKK